MSAEPTGFTGDMAVIDRLLAKEGFRLSRGTLSNPAGEELPTVCIDRPDSPDWQGIWSTVESDQDEENIAFLLSADAINLKGRTQNEDHGPQDSTAGTLLNRPPSSVFELVDCTNDETYFPMGLFLSLEDALAQVKDRKKPPTDDPEEFVRMEVRERQIGKLRWWDNGNTVATIQWIQDYIETKDEWVWHTPTISLPNDQSEPHGPTTKL